MRMIGVGGFGSEGPFPAGFKVESLHVSGHTVATAGNALSLQTDRQPRAAIDFAMAGKEMAETFPQPLIFQCPPAGQAPAPGVVGTARHAQRVAEVFDGVVLCHMLDQGIPPGGRSDSMPMAFFRIS